MSAPRRFALASDVANNFDGLPPVAWSDWRADLDRFANQDVMLGRQREDGNVDLEINLDDELTLAVEAAARRANVSVEDYLRQAIRRYTGLPTSHRPISAAWEPAQLTRETDADR